MMIPYYIETRDGKHMRDNTLINYTVDVNELNPNTNEIIPDKTDTEKAAEIMENILCTISTDARIIINDQNLAQIVFDLISGKKVVMTQLASDYDYKVGDIVDFDENMNTNIYKKYESEYHIIIAYNNGFKNIDIV